MSSTVTVALQELWLPLVSVTVRVTVLVPTSAQTKLQLSSARLAMPQASMLTLAISAVVLLALPVLVYWKINC